MRTRSYIRTPERENTHTITQYAPYTQKMPERTINICLAFSEAVQHSFTLNWNSIASIRSNSFSKCKRYFFKKIPQKWQEMKGYEIFRYCQLKKSICYYTQTHRLINSIITRSNYFIATGCTSKTLQNVLLSNLKES